MGCSFAGLAKARSESFNLQRMHPSQFPAIIELHHRFDGAIIYAYAVAQTLVHVLNACGDNLTRENVMKQAASLKDLELGGLLPGIKINTSATDFAPVSQVQLMRFKGETWERFGEIINGDGSD